MLIDHEDILRSFDSTIEDLLNICDGELTILRMPDGSLNASVDPFDALSALERSGSTNVTLRSMIVDACKKSELIAPGSTKFILRTLQVLSDELDPAQSAQNMLALITSHTQRATRESVNTCLSRLMPSISDLIIEAIDLAGSECKIFVEPSTNGYTTVERTTGNIFKISPDPVFVQSPWVTNDVKCLVVDGMIETVSEIDHILEKCHTLKQPMVIFARGYSNDVLNTLRVNFSRKTLNVVPVLVRFDLETANVLTDVAAVLNCDIVSALKGELISTVKFDDLPFARSVQCRGNEVIITNATSRNLENHIARLLDKRSNEHIPGIKSILDRRIRSLASSSVVIRIDDHGLTGAKKMQDIDRALKIVQACLRHGVAIDLNTLNAFKDVQIIPSIVASAAVYYAYETLRLIKQTGALLLAN